jgi:hypothetical protein
MLSLRFLDASIWPSLTDALLDRVEKPIVNKIKRINNEIELMASVTHGGISSMEFYQIPDINPFWVEMDVYPDSNSIFRVIIE